MLRLRPFLAFTLVSAMLFSSLPMPAVRADAPPSDADRERAAALKKKADAAMDAYKFLDAIEGYDEAYALSHDPAILYNRGRALQALGRFPEALDALESFQKEASPELIAKVPKLSELLYDVRLHVSHLTVVCNVAGAKVRVRDRQIAITPMTTAVPLSVGPAKLEVVVDGYFPYTQAIELPPGGGLTVQAQLVARSLSGILVVRSAVVGSAVAIDGRAIGVAPVEVALPAGAHRVSVSREGYEESDTSAIVELGERKEVSIDLAPVKPITAKWWFWTGLGVVVVSGVVITYALLTEKKAGSGDLQPGQTAGPLLRW